MSTANNAAARKPVGELLERLSAKRQELMRRVLEHPREYVLLSVRDLGKKLRTDPGNTIRIITAMGFSGYRNFQRYLHELSVAHATSLDLARDTVSARSGPRAQVQDALDHDAKNLQALRHTLDLKRISALAKRFYQARRILLIGGDLASSLVEFIEYHLTVLDFPVIGATTPGRVVHTIRSVRGSDLVLAISFQRGLRQTVDGLQRARGKGAYCVGITDTSVSPVARLSNEYFVVSIDNPLGASYVAPMALLNVLLVAIGNERRTRTIALLKEVDREQRTGYRWYPD